MRFWDLLVDPKRVKKIDHLTVFFMLLRSLRVKAVRRMLMKLSPGVNFINILRANFSYMLLEKSCQKVFRMKKARVKSIDEIDGWSSP